MDRVFPLCDNCTISAGSLSRIIRHRPLKMVIFPVDQYLGIASCLSIHQRKNPRVTIQAKALQISKLNRISTKERSVMWSSTKGVPYLDEQLSLIVKNWSFLWGFACLVPQWIVGVHIGRKTTPTAPIAFFTPVSHGNLKNEV